MTAQDWRTGPMIGFDLETTSTDVETARIVEFAFVAVRGDHAGVHTRRVNPGVPIPPEATSVHGITDDDVANAMSHDAAVGTILAELDKARSSGRPIVGMNLAYDLTVVARHWTESVAHLDGVDEMTDGSMPFLLDLLILDKQVDRYRKGSRRLVDVARHYGVEIPEGEAHGAVADAKAAALATRALLDRDPGILNGIGLDELWGCQRRWRREQQQSFSDYLVSQGKVPLDPSEFVWPIMPKRETPQPVTLSLRGTELVVPWSPLAERFRDLLDELVASLREASSFDGFDF